MATPTLNPAPAAAPPSTIKRRAKRLGTVTVSLLALLALGISFAFFLSTEDYADNEATGGTLEVVASGLPLSAGNLFPTSASDGGTNAREQAFTIDNVNPATVKYTMTALCDVCDPDSDQLAQWENLYISIEDAAGTVVYRGRLADMNTGYQPASSPVSNPLSPPGTPAGGAADLGTIDPSDSSQYTTRIWLKESGQEQPQTISSSWTFFIEARTV